MAITNLTMENFETEVEDSSLPVLVDFWAPWCGHCLALSPVIDQVSQAYEGKLKVAKVNIDDQKSLAMKHRVLSIPTLLLVRDGKIKASALGAKSNAEMEAWLKENGVA